MSTSEAAKMDTGLTGSQYKSGISFTSYTMEPKLALPILYNILKTGHNVKFIEKSLETIDELKGNYDLVINCTGLGSRTLVQDDTFMLVLFKNNSNGEF